MNAEREPKKDLLPALAVALMLIAVAWLFPAAVVVTHARALPQCAVADLVAGTGRLIASGPASDPRRAYPPCARELMPEGRSWWLAGLAPLVGLGVGAGMLFVRFEPLRARARLGRRAGDPRGASPREWGRPRDLTSLVVRRRTTDRFTLGYLDRRLLAGDSEAHVAVVAPTRSGKTTSCVIPWLLEHPGPAIVTSTKRDVHAATKDWRARLGEVHVWDPGAPDSALWTPVDGCDAWPRSLRQALWLADAVDAGESSAARYWNGEASKLLAPLLHAAALDERGMGDVIAWLDAQEVDAPAAILDASGATAAKRQLEAVAGLDPRNRGTTYQSAGSLLAAYRHPDVLQTACAGLSAESFLSGANTLYVCAPAHRQRELAPLVVALLSSIFEHAATRAGSDGPLQPTLRVLLDELANIAPIRNLPQLLSQASSQGVRIAPVVQSIAQLEERYGSGAQTILANCTAKLFMGPVTDQTTGSYLAGLLGHQRDGESQPEPKATAQALQQLTAPRAVLVAGAHTPATVRLTPYWSDRELARRARGR